jgi:hypothetical protein
MQTFIDIFQKHSNTDVKIKIEPTHCSAFSPYFAFISDETGKEHSQILCEYLHRKENQSSEPEHNSRNFYLFLYLSSLIYDAIQKPSSNNDASNYISIIIKSKFHHLNKLLTNIFVQDSIKENFFDIFEKTQKTYHAFSKLAQIYKLKKYASNIKINTDLYLNPIDTKNKNSILIIQEKNGYWFSISDLMSHIETSLINSPFFFSEPLRPKNPYNNIPFSNFTLYNIYFHVSELRRQFIPPLFHNFFLCEFDLEKFRIENEYLIRDKYIIKYAINIDEDRLFSEVRYMLRYMFDNRITISDDFPKDELSRIMRPYYYLFLVSRYHVSGIEKTNMAKKLLLKKLKELHRHNPKFGKMILKPKNITYQSKNKSNRNKYDKIFQTEHPKFTMQNAIQILSCKNYSATREYEARRPIFGVAPQERLPNPISTYINRFGRGIHTQVGPNASDASDDSDDSDESEESESDDIFIRRRLVNPNPNADTTDPNTNMDTTNIIMRNIEQLLAEDSESINEFEELQREEYDSES